MRKGWKKHDCKVPGCTSHYRYKKYDPWETCVYAHKNVSMVWVARYNYGIDKVFKTRTAAMNFVEKQASGGE